MNHNLKIFPTSQSRGFIDQVARVAGTRPGQVELETFSDGEPKIKFKENLRGKDVFIVGSTNQPDRNLLEHLVMIDAAKRASARHITAVIPYFGFSRQDRKDEPRTPITAKLVANLISAAGCNRVITMDLHAGQIQGFFDIPVDHLYASAVFIPFLKRKKLRNLVVVSPDIGGMKRAKKYAEYLGAEFTVLPKERPRANQSKLIDLPDPLNFKDKTVIVVDDMVDTAGTFINAVDLARSLKAEAIYGCCTHAVLSRDAIRRLQQTPKLIAVYITDTIPRDTTYARIEVKSVAAILGQAILASHQNKSISKLFIESKD
jgi:ribose-phosphate pyrophosphokinase